MYNYCNIFKSLKFKNNYSQLVVLKISNYNNIMFIIIIIENKN